MRRPTRSRSVAGFWSARLGSNMAENPHTYSEQNPTPKGHTFTAESPFVPPSLRPGGRLHGPERLQSWLDEQNARWKIVETCRQCKPSRPLVAEEVLPHRL